LYYWSVKKPIIPRPKKIVDGELGWDVWDLLPHLQDERDTWRKLVTTGHNPNALPGCGARSLEEVAELLFALANKGQEVG
jgi:hypothetical protein